MKYGMLRLFSLYDYFKLLCVYGFDLLKVLLQITTLLLFLFSLLYPLLILNLTTNAIIDGLWSL